MTFDNLTLEVRQNNDVLFRVDRSAMVLQPGSVDERYAVFEAVVLAMGVLCEVDVNLVPSNYLHSPRNDNS